MDFQNKALIGGLVILIAIVFFQLFGLTKTIESLRGLADGKGASFNDILRRYTFKNSNLNSTKPNLWIHLTVNKNLPFPGPSSLAGAPINEPFSFKNVPALERLCAGSVIDHNKNDFNIILFTDNDLPLLLPGWNVNLAAIPEAGRCVVRQIAKLRLVYYYGGLICPSTFAATAPFASVLSTSSLRSKSKITAFEMPLAGANVGPAAQRSVLAPSSKFLYSRELNPNVRQIIDALSVKTGTEAQVSAFKDLAADVMMQLTKEKKVRAISGKVIGTADVDGNSVTVAESINGFQRAPESIGIYVPIRVFEVREYGWLIYDNPIDIIKGGSWFARQLRT